MDKNNQDYTQLPQPYDNLLSRDPAGTIPDNGNVMTQPVNTGGAMGDVWIQTFIKSTNYSPKKTGFYIDGQKGYAEFCNVFISGEIQALTGIIGGFVIGANSFVSSNGLLELDSNGTIKLFDNTIGDTSPIQGDAAEILFIRND